MKVMEFEDLKRVRTLKNSFGFVCEINNLVCRMTLRSTHVYSVRASQVTVIVFQHCMWLSLLVNN